MGDSQLASPTFGVAIFDIIVALLALRFPFHRKVLESQFFVLNLSLLENGQRERMKMFSAMLQK